jgi:hypothetical protein
MCVGFGIALFVLIYGGRIRNSWAIFLLCPTSIAGIALDNSPFIVAVVDGGSMIVLGNTIWYALLFGLVGVLLEKTRTPPGPGAR